MDERESLDKGLVVTSQINQSHWGLAEMVVARAPEEIHSRDSFSSLEGTELAEQKALALLTIPASRLALIWSQGPRGSCRSDAALRRLETGHKDGGVAAGSMLAEQSLRLTLQAEGI